MKSFIKINSNGEIETFYKDFKNIENKIKDKKIERVSHIAPKNLLLRTAFRLIRSIVSDESRIADWTRNWKCDWIVIMDKKKYGPFKNRKKAIEFERKQFIEKKKKFN